MMDFVAAHPLLVTAVASLAAIVAVWFVARIAIAWLREFIRALWPH